MIKYKIILSVKAEENLEHFKKSGNQIILKKIKTLFIELSTHPTSGTGKPEKLKHQFSGLWSRRINKEHRIIYEIIDNKCIVLIISMNGHYK